MPERVGNPRRRRRHFIAEWRAFRGMTQQELADRLETSKAWVSRLEALKIGYTQDSLEAVADVLGTFAPTLLQRPPSDEDRRFPPADGARIPPRHR